MVSFSREATGVLLAALRGLAAKSGGFDKAKATDDAFLLKNKFVRFYFNGDAQAELFGQYAREYIRDNHQANIQIAHDKAAPVLLSPMEKKLKIYE
jgi:hypothetical protein